MENDISAVPTKVKVDFNNIQVSENSDILDAANASIPDSNVPHLPATIGTEIVPSQGQINEVTVSMPTGNESAQMPVVQGEVVDDNAGEVPAIAGQEFQQLPPTTDIPAGAVSKNEGQPSQEPPSRESSQKNTADATDQNTAVPEAKKVMPAGNFFDRLGITENATDEEIKTAFREMAKIWHPDKNANSDESVEAFKLINEAYSTLSNPEKRNKYKDTLSQVADSIKNIIPEDDRNEIVANGFRDVGERLLTLTPEEQMAITPQSLAELVVPIVSVQLIENIKNQDMSTKQVINTLVNVAESHLPKDATEKQKKEFKLLLYLAMAIAAIMDAIVMESYRDFTNSDQEIYLFAGLGALLSNSEIFKKKKKTEAPTQTNATVNAEASPAATVPEQTQKEEPAPVVKVEMPFAENTIAQIENFGVPAPQIEAVTASSEVQDEAKTPELTTTNAPLLPANIEENIVEPENTAIAPSEKPQMDPRQLDAIRKAILIAATKLHKTESVPRSATQTSGTFNR
jgi:hypothetical protein